LIAVFVFSRLKEPDRWVAAKAAADQTKTNERFGRISDLFTNRIWRRNTFVGLGLAIAGQIGLWGIGFYTPELIDSAIPAIEPAMRPKIEAIIETPADPDYANALRALNEKEKRKYTDLVARIVPARNKTEVARTVAAPLTGELREKMRATLAKAIPEDRKTNLKMWGGILQQVGAFLGMSCFTIMAARFGRRLSFLLALLLAWGSLVFTFSTFHHPAQVWYLWPLLGFCTLAPFGGYAIYFPELFPTRLRTTGTSFCYNVGRYVTAFGVSILGPLAAQLQGVTSMPGFRLAAIILSSAYLIGLVTLIWAPETVNQPLPEDENVLSH
jgi:hypothetical protein